MDAYKPLAPLVKRFSDILNGAPGKLELVEYKAGMEIKKGVIYYSMQKVKGMPKDCILATVQSHKTR